MELEIRPEPTDDERRAILAAFAEDVAAEPAPYRSRWREAALEEGVGVDAEALDEPSSAAAD